VIHAGGGDYTFRHALIRDAAYRGLAKESRASLHERQALLLAEASLGEVDDETIGYHLEQAVQHHEQLRPPNDATHALAARAADHLTRAGRRALARGDVPGAVALLTRATVLLRDDDRARVRVAVELGGALTLRGDLDQAEAVLERALATARAVGDEGGEAAALLRRAELRVLSEGDASAEVAVDVSGTIEPLATAGDESGLARATHLLSYLEMIRGRFSVAASTLERALSHAERAHDLGARASIRIARLTCLYWGPATVSSASAACEEALADPDTHVLEAEARALLAGLAAMQGRFDDARVLAEQSCAALEELGAPIWLARARRYAASVELRAGDLFAAERELRASYALFEAAGAPPLDPAALLADVLCLQGRFDEAQTYADACARAAGRDFFSQVEWRRPTARLLAARGSFQDALRLLDEGLALAAEAECPDKHAELFVTRAEIAARAGAPDDAAEAWSAAAALYEAKENVVGAANARRALVPSA
jgi:tetratricopeptide (TPR) repeat protein